MSHFTLFATADAFFELLLTSCGQPRPTLAFRRFLPFEPGFVIPPDDASLAAAYVGGGFREVWLSLSGAPEHARDWDFSTRCASDILVVEGGRSDAAVLEGWEVRVFAKDSNVRPLYRRLRRHVTARSVKGMCHRDTGTCYQFMFCDPSAAGFELRTQFDSAGSVYIPAPATSHRRRPANGT